MGLHSGREYNWACGNQQWYGRQHHNLSIFPAAEQSARTLVNLRLSIDEFI